MKKIFVITAVIAAFSTGAALYAEDQAQQQGGDSSAEVVVKGQLKIKIDAEAPVIEVKTDANEVAQSVISTEETFLNISPEDVKDVKASLPDVMLEERTDYHVEKSLLETQPIFKISPKIPAGIDIDKWNFKVTDSTGGTVKLQKGEGRLPDVISWDGYDREGRILKVGSPYWYVLTYIDRAGNPGSVRRETPKQVDALMYRQDGKLAIEISSNYFFEPKRKDRMTDNGRDVMVEVQDYIKMRNTYPVIIQVYSEDTGMARDQLRSIEKVLAEKLKLPKDFFKMEGFIDNSLPKNYRVKFLING
ncbi:MAG: hypothetical protein LLG37_10350 [Spirochaetia bacterium]|nr:hypothetical protein [Spirochaetia bacterium]